MKKQNKTNYWKIAFWILIIILIFYAIFSLNSVEESSSYLDYELCVNKCVSDFDICTIKGGILRHQDSTDMYLNCLEILESCVYEDCKE